MSAAKACAEILCCDDTLDKLAASSSPNSTLTNMANAHALNARNPNVFTWLSQLLEHANTEMKMYEACKCALPNEVYMLALNVCTQLLDLSLNRSATYGNKNKFVVEWIIQKCYSSISTEIADLCFIALAKVYIEFSNENIVSSNRSKTGCNSQKSQTTSPAQSHNHCFDSTYLSNLFIRIFRSY